MHTFRVHTAWTGDTGLGYGYYSRDHELSAQGKAQAIPGSSDRAFRGDSSRYNPEELLVASLSSCHLLWMLHLCADAGIAVTAYADNADGDMALNPDGSGQFVRVTLRPELTVTNADHVARLDELHHRAHELCFISRSVNFPVQVQPRGRVAS
jgi:organic hydroperoxide reductase OsmC/OhrA